MTEYTASTLTPVYTLCRGKNAPCDVCSDRPGMTGDGIYGLALILTIPI